MLYSLVNIRIHQTSDKILFLFNLEIKFEVFHSYQY